MIVVIKPNVYEERVSSLIQRIEDMGLSIHYSKGSSTTILGLLGDTSSIDERTLLADSAVEYVRRVTEPYKAVNRKMHPDDTVLEVAGRKIGEGYFNIFAGPCSVESEDQILMVAEAVKKAGASFLLHRIPFRGLRPKASGCSLRPSARPACRSSPKS